MFNTARPLRKNIQNKAGTINDTNFKVTLKVSLLSWGKYVVEYNNIQLIIAHCVRYFIGLARSDKQGGIGT